MKGYFEGFIEDNNNNKVVHRQLEYFEEVNKERSEENYNKDVESLYSDFNKDKKITKNKEKFEKKDENKENPIIQK